MRMNLINKIYNLLVKHNITDIYNSLSIDPHTIVLQEDNVTVYEVYTYGYADIIGLTSEEFATLEYTLNSTN